MEKAKQRVEGEGEREREGGGGGRGRNEQRKGEEKGIYCGLECSSTGYFAQENCTNGNRVPETSSSSSSSSSSNTAK